MYLHHPRFYAPIKRLNGCAVVIFLGIIIVVSFVMYLIYSPIAYYLSIKPLNETCHSYFYHYFEFPSKIYEDSISYYREVYKDGCSYTRNDNFWDDADWSYGKIIRSEDGYYLEDTDAIKHPFCIRPLKYYQPLDSTFHFY